jgi:hypothetical protein
MNCEHNFFIDSFEPIFSFNLLDFFLSTGILNDSRVADITFSKKNDNCRFILNIYNRCFLNDLNTFIARGSYYNIKDNGTDPLKLTNISILPKVIEKPIEEKPIEEKLEIEEKPIEEKPEIEEKPIKRLEIVKKPIEEKPEIEEKPIKRLEIVKKPIKRLEIEEKPNVIEKLIKENLEIEEKPEIVEKPIEEKPNVIEKLIKENLEIEEKPEIVEKPIEEKPNVIEKPIEEKPIFGFKTISRKKKFQNNKECAQNKMHRKLRVVPQKQDVSVNLSNSFDILSKLNLESEEEFPYLK